MKSIDPSKCGAHLSRLRHKTGGKGRKRDMALLQFDAL
jgi:hypothetical protein